MAAIRDTLDRAGMAAPRAVDVSVTAKPYESLIEDLAIESGSRAEYRASVGRPDPEPESLSIENTNRPGGLRVLGETFDGHLVLDGEVASDD